MKLFIAALITFVLSAGQVFAAVADDSAWVTGTVKGVDREIATIETQKGERIKLKRAWIEKSMKDCRPGMHVRVEVKFDEVISLNSK